MNKIIFAALFFTLHLHSGVIKAQGKELRFRQLTLENGLSNGEVTSILQDKKGFIWIGTSSGLNRYDGFSTEVFYNNTLPKTSVYQNRIYDMSLANNNCIWLATEGGLCLFNPSLGSYSQIKTNNSIDEKLLKQSISKLMAVNNKVYIVSAKNIYVFEVNENNVLKRININNLQLSWPIFDIEKDNKSQVWLTHGNYISVFGTNDEELKIKMNESAGNAIALYIDANEFVYVNMEHGLYKLSQNYIQSLQKNKIKITDINSNEFQKIANYTFEVKNNSFLHSLKKDNQGNFWFGSSSGLKKVNVFNNTIDTYSENEYNKLGISSNFITTIFIDQSSCLWVGTFGAGTNIADLNQKEFQLIQKAPNTTNTLSSNHIRALLKEDNGNLWIGTSDGGLNHYNASSQTYTLYNQLNSTLESNNIRSLTKDKNNQLWIATQTTISSRNTNGNITNLKPGLSNTSTLGNYTSVATDIYNQIWTGSWGNGLCKITYGSNKKFEIEHFTENSSVKGILSNKIAYVYADKKKPEILVGTDHGLNHIFLNADGSVKKITNYDGNNKYALSSSFIRQIERQGDSVIWVSTYGGGINKINLLANNNFTIEHIGKNLPALRDIELILLDDKNNLWLGGTVLAMYNIEKKEFEYFDVNDGLQGNSFLKGATAKGVNGQLYFGGNNGITFFNPNLITPNTYKPSAVFTNLIVNGVSTNTTENFKSINEPIGYKKEIKLTYLQNNFTIQFSAMHFANPNKCKFRYKLEGFDKDWINTDASNRFATYSNLEFGTYVLKVMASNNDGLWTSETTDLKITIVAPWWKSTIAKIMYLLIVIILAYTIWRNKQSLFNLKRKLEIKNLEEKKQEEIHKMKLQFFTNISHEFRTPLTLILGPTEKMLHEKNTEQQNNNYLRIIYSNAKRLLGLINELMDFRLAESDMFQLKVSEGNIEKLIDSIANEFKEMANQRNIDYKISVSSNLSNVYFDPSIVEKIIVNLLSNAFKYTENKGHIEIEILKSITDYKAAYKNHIHIQSAVQENNLFWIRIADTGIGIDKKSISNIFDRYFRVNTTGNEKQMGSGVGLALVKSLIELHKGHLKVYSEQNAGSEFLVGLPVIASAYNAKELNNSNSHKIDFENLQFTVDWLANNEIKNNRIEDTATETTVQKNKTTGKKRILIVEDNEDMRHFLSNSFSNDFEIIEAINGLDGFNKACEFLPDLIVSDLMMPILDGNELCKKIREDITTCHTPFILITANASVESQIKSSEYGADIYFPKPVSLRLLEATIKNLFDTRNRLKEKYNQDVFAETREIVTNQKDKDFLDELIDVIEKNMDKEELDVELICRKMGMSRTKLYGKVKIITGQPIGEFTRLLRFKKAAKLMIAEDLPIAEVMNLVGIQSQSYFIKQFKKEFGKTPAAYVAEFTTKHIGLSKNEIVVNNNAEEK